VRHAGTRPCNQRNIWEREQRARCERTQARTQTRDETQQNSGAFSPQTRGGRQPRAQTRGKQRCHYVEVANRLRARRRRGGRYEARGAGSGTLENTRCDTSDRGIRTHVRLCGADAHAQSSHYAVLRALRCRLRRRRRRPGRCAHKTSTGVTRTRELEVKRSSWPPAGEHARAPAQRPHTTSCEQYGRAQHAARAHLLPVSRCAAGCTWCSRTAVRGLGRDAATATRSRPRPVEYAGASGMPASSAASATAASCMCAAGNGDCPTFPASHAGKTKRWTPGAGVWRMEVRAPDLISPSRLSP
jgi:hypothetical protein